MTLGIIEAKHDLWRLKYLMMTTVLWENPQTFDTKWAGEPGQHLIQVPNGDDICLTVSESVANTNYDAIVVSFMGFVADPQKFNSTNFMVNHSIDSQIPAIHITDPRVQNKSHIKLSWYFGDQNFEYIDNLIMVLKSIQRNLFKELVFVGGNGGGFAALHLGKRFKGSCSVVCWDAHTDIYESPAPFVKPFLKDSFNFSNSTLQSIGWKSFCKKRTYDKLTSSVNTGETIYSPKRIIYLQDSDPRKSAVHANLLWQQHSLEALSEGINRIDDDRGFILNNYEKLNSAEYLADINSSIYKVLDLNHQPFAH